MKYLMPAIRLKVFMTVLLGLAYPFLMTGAAQVLFPTQSQGGFIARDGKIVGASLIAQKFEKPEYFWPRPSAVDYNPLASGGSNLGPISQDLVKAAHDRSIRLQTAHGESAGEPPQELIFASASGLDPHLSLEAVTYQAARVALARKLSVDQVQQLITEHTQGPQWGVFGETTVNVLALNLALDQLHTP